MWERCNTACLHLAARLRLIEGHKNSMSARNGLWLGSVSGCVALLVVAIPVAMAINGLRMFFTGFLSHFVDPALGEGVMHYTEGWVLFIVAFVFLGGFTWLLTRVGRFRRLRREG